MDWNNDGKLDLIAGDTQGNVWLFLNTGTREKAVLAEGVRAEADGKAISASRTTYKMVNGKVVADKATEGSSPLAEVYSKIHMADWDGDGLKDLLVGHSSTIVFYKNAGTASAPKLLAPTKLECPGGSFPMRPSPYMVDWDGDGKKDLLVGCEQPMVQFYRNVGTAQSPKLAEGKPLDLKGDGFEKGFRCRVEVTDWNGDGKLDLLLGNTCPSTGGRGLGGNVWLFLGK
ncbi:MAG: VCBS repeat-containing protein [Planctomycetes bacterium]|nr:VCBS repeat-containing protein [Planctomycetota bacterium]